MSRFAERRVVVTGAGSGIGRATVASLLADGARVVAADLDVTGVPSGALAVRADVSSADDVRGLIATAVESIGGIDILCNNAGVGSTSNAIDETPEHWDQVFAVNVRGVFLGIKYALPEMLAQGHGVIVNTASVAGLIGLADRAAYCASKGAVVALTKQVAVQWAAAGIRCNCVCPGTVDSPWVAALINQADDPVERRANLVGRQPLGRLGRPDEIASAILYLASDEAAFVTGTALVADGGITAA